MTRWRMHAAFPETALQAITQSVPHSEQFHGGEIRVAIEAELSLSALWRAQTPRARALEVFAALSVWDTEQRNGVLLYLCLADHSVEIVADRGLQAQVSDAEWVAICTQLQAECGAGKFSAGVAAAVTAIGKLIGRHFPTADRNELSDRPTLL